MKESQGAKANRTGHTIENMMIPIFEGKGIKVYNYSELCKKEIREEISKSKQYVLKEVPYKNAYDSKGKTEFVIYHDEIETRVEIKWQTENGSVDEKFIYMFYNAVNNYPENDIILIVDGGGYKPGARKWLENAIENDMFDYKEKGKTIKLMYISDFIRYCNKDFK